MLSGYIGINSMREERRFLTFISKAKNSSMRVTEEEKRAMFQE
jgi:hypothetical protein